MLLRGAIDSALVQQLRDNTKLSKFQWARLRLPAHVIALVFSKYPRNLIDIALYQNTLFYMLEDGQVKVNKVNQEGYFEEGEIAIKSSEQKIAKGHFAILPKSGGNGCAIFVNNNFISQISLDGNTIKPVKNYQSMKYYESAIPL